jgi:hypothetical protein
MSTLRIGCACLATLRRFVAGSGRRPPHQNENSPILGLCQLLPPAPDIGLPMLPPPCANSGPPLDPKLAPQKRAGPFV